MSTRRADRALVERGLVASRTLAQRLIEDGHVYRRDGLSRTQVTRASDPVPPDASLEIEHAPLCDYVSRGGIKLAHALDRAGLDVRGWRCLDVGQSTGGFTDCLLQRGAAHVTGIDVGHGQLAARLRTDPRVTALEGINARNLVDQVVPGPFDLIVADLSFISLTQVLARWPARLAPDGRVLALVKPQFEVGRSALGKGGIVRDPTCYAAVEARIRTAAHAAGLTVIDWFDSPITGGDGNREFFLHARCA
ncbi:MAG: TlyA family RNA methyltransferase [Casimicrobiaceae bacterium]